MEIPLFLLNAVLHSGGSLSLRVFEARYKIGRAHV